MKTKTNQSGRSMIEMLGVLAIIGVLSVGGIAGYSKAMSKYRINKTADQITQIINGVRTLYSGQKNYAGLNNTVLRKAKILPESAFEGSTSFSATNPFGGTLYIHATDRKNPSDNRAVQLELDGLPDDVCIELATQDWGAGEGLFAVAVNSTPYGPMEGCSGGFDNDIHLMGCAGGSTVPLPISVDKAMVTCGGRSYENSNSLGFYFY